MNSIAESWPTTAHRTHVAILRNGEEWTTPSTSHMLRLQQRSMPYVFIFVSPTRSLLGHVLISHCHSPLRVHDQLTEGQWSEDRGMWSVLVSDFQGANVFVARLVKVQLRTNSRQRQTFRQRHEAQLVTTSWVTVQIRLSMNHGMLTQTNTSSSSWSVARTRLRIRPILDDPTRKWTKYLQAMLCLAQSRRAS